MSSRLFIPIFLFASLTSNSAGEDFDDKRAQVLALGELTAAPKTFPAEGFQASQNIDALYFEGLPYNGKPTRVFARLGVPEGAKKPMPGVVLVHGGGGSAFAEWVAEWNKRGYAAISIAVEGQTDAKEPDTKTWARHEHSGPARNGIYGDSAQPLPDQWMYHAVADTILANSLLRSFPEVDPDRVGLMGISWGGIITSTVIGIDQRFAFAIPTYGCGDLADSPNQYGRALGKNQLYRQVWDPMIRLENATMPTLWFSWTGDEHFPLNHQANSYGKVAGKHMVSLVPKMGHGHPPGWRPEDSYAFADSVLKEGRPWCLQTEIKVDGAVAKVGFDCSKKIASAILTSTTDLKNWKDSPAAVDTTGNTVIISATIPQDASHWFVLLKSDTLHATSDLQATR